MGKSHIVVTGTGRAGTSFIMQILTELGEDTGFDNAVAHYNEEIRAGLEPTSFNECLKDHAPKILKSPGFCGQLRKMIPKGFNVEHMIIPVRDLEEVTRSRLKAGLQLHGRSDEVQQQLVEQDFGKLMETVVVEELPHTFIKFDAMIRTPEYLFDKLAPIFKWKKSKYEIFKKAYIRFTPKGVRK